MTGQTSMLSKGVRRIQHDVQALGAQAHFRLLLSRVTCNGKAFRRHATQWPHDCCGF
ncbi:hypothetical protein PSEUDO8Z_60377 [Pseudomonas sp. 8Z]|nr:hypothetical protein PSEUDO8Z_60377 [Pseudomonas sp. 8Z]